jgi:hypothetical protein
MPDSMADSGSALLWFGVALIIVAVVFVAYVWYRGRPLPGAHVFRASRMSRGNLLFPTQVAVTETSVVHYTPQWVGGREQSMHLAHIASVAVDRNLFFANVMIESSGGASPVLCHGHRKADAIEMKRLIEQFQSEYYRSRGAAGGTGEAPRPA